MSRCGIAACATLLGLYSAMADQMDAPKVHNESFEVVGIEARTTNAQEMSGKGMIPKLWGRFMQENLLEKIPNRVGSDVIVLNTDYQSDKNGEYTYVLGAKVSSTADVPPGMTIHRVPAGEYAKFSGEEIFTRGNRGLMAANLVARRLGTACACLQDRLRSSP